MLGSWLDDAVIWIPRVANKIFVFSRNSGGCLLSLMKCWNVFRISAIWSINYDVEMKLIPVFDSVGTLKLLQSWITQSKIRNCTREFIEYFCVAERGISDELCACFSRKVVFFNEGQNSCRNLTRRNSPAKRDISETTSNTFMTAMSYSRIKENFERQGSIENMGILSLSVTLTTK